MQTIIHTSSLPAHSRRHFLRQAGVATFTVELALEGGTEVTCSVVENQRLSREFVRQIFQA